MARINLLTIHWGCSYGGTMQTYATIRLLENLGHKVTLINLVHPNHKFKIGKHRGVSWIITDLLFFFFRLFYFGKMTKRMYSIKKKCIPKCDYTVVGSDQVWNEDITKPINVSYFLDFVEDSEKIAFASSFGKYRWESDKDTTERVKECLSGFKSISVREETGVAICRETFKINAVQVLDPTLVYNNYNHFVEDIKEVPKLFPFLLINTEQTDEICDFITKELHLQQYRVSKINNALSSGPISWMRKIKGSEFIVTDSFHGLAFCLMFHKQFVVLCANEKKFTRLMSLLTLVGLSKRFVQSVNDLRSRKEILHNNINYDTVDKILDFERQKSVLFLKSCLI